MGRKGLVEDDPSNRCFEPIRSEPWRYRPLDFALPFAGFAVSCLRSPFERNEVDSGGSRLRVAMSSVVIRLNGDVDLDLGVEIDPAQLIRQPSVVEIGEDMTLTLLVQASSR